MWSDWLWLSITLWAQWAGGFVHRKLHHIISALCYYITLYYRCFLWWILCRLKQWAEMFPFICVQCSAVSSESQIPDWGAGGDAPGVQRGAGESEPQPEQLHQTGTAQTSRCPSESPASLMDFLLWFPTATACISIFSFDFRAMRLNAWRFTSGDLKTRYVRTFLRKFSTKCAFIVWSCVFTEWKTLLWKYVLWR